MKTRISIHQRIFLPALLAAALSADAQTPLYVFTKLVDSNDPIPGGNGALFQPNTQAAFDGATAAFWNGGNFAFDSIWSTQAGGAPLKLVDLATTNVPGGTGKFTQLFINFSGPGYVQMSNGVVVFAGRDSSTSGYNGGLYSVSAAGGPISRVANGRTAIPGGTGSFSDGFQFFSVSGTRVVFNGVGTVAGDGGLYAADINGANPAGIANGAHPAHPEFTFPITNFALPAVSGTNVAFFGNGVFDPSTGYNALYGTSTAGGFLYSEPVNSNVPLPGDATAVFHTRFGAPRLDGDNLFFAADDANTNPNFFGLFRVARGGGAITRIVDVNSTLPGVSPISSFPSYAASGTQLAFTASGPNNQYGLYVGDGTTIAKVAAAGDAGPFADTRGKVEGLDLGSGAFSGGQLVARVNAPSFSAFGLYLITPFAQSADVSSALAANPASPAVGSNTTLTLTVTNNGPATAQGPVARVTLPPGLTFLSASGGGTFDAPSRTVLFPLAALPSGGTAGVTVATRVDVTGVITASGYVTANNADSNRRNNHSFVSVPAPSLRGSYYQIRTIADTRTVIPDRTGQTFNFIGGNNPLPATDGDRVLFAATETGASALWSAKLDGTGGFTRLVTSGIDAIPGFPGETFDGFAFMRLRNGTATFFGSAASAAHRGLFSLPVAGGPLALIANSTTPRPGGGPAFDFNGYSAGQLGDGQFTFALQNGIYAFPASGGGSGTAVVLRNSNLPIGTRSAVFFYEPAVSGNRVIFDTGGTISVNSSFLDERRFETNASFLDVSPSDAQGGVFGSIDGPQVEGNTVVFRAASGSTQSILGFYSVTGTGAPVKLVDTSTPVPGGTGNFLSFGVAGNTTSFSFSGGEVIFIGTDAGNNRAGIYSVPAAGGAIRKVAAVGDVISGRSFLQNFTQPPIQVNALGQRQVVFQANFFDFATNVGGFGVYAAAPVSRLINLSTRLRVETGDNIGIAGFVITGGGNKRLLIRAAGPSLGAFGVTSPLADPVLVLKNSAGATIQQNDNWKSTQQAEIMASGFAPTNDLESAMVVSLGAGSYTALVSGNGGGSGVGIVEVYDLDPVSDANSARLINVSTRGRVQTGENVMIGGFVLGGFEPRKVVVRGIGPALTAFGVPGALQNPIIQLISGPTTLAVNDDWRATQQAEIIASTFPPTDNRESAIVATLPPGPYTVIVSGLGDTSGVGLVEIYELP